MSFSSRRTSNSPSSSSYSHKTQPTLVTSNESSKQQPQSFRENVAAIPKRYIKNSFSNRVAQLNRQHNEMISGEEMQRMQQPRQQYQQDSNPTIAGVFNQEYNQKRATSSHFNVARVPMLEFSQQTTDSPSGQLLNASAQPNYVKPSISNQNQSQSFAINESKALGNVQFRQRTRNSAILNQMENPNISHDYGQVFQRNLGQNVSNQNRVSDFDHNTTGGVISAKKLSLLGSVQHEIFRSRSVSPPRVLSPKVEPVESNKSRPQSTELISEELRSSSYIDLSTLHMNARNFTGAQQMLNVIGNENKIDVGNFGDRGDLGRYKEFGGACQSFSNYHVISQPQRNFQYYDQDYISKDYQDQIHKNYYVDYPANIKQTGSSSKSQLKLAKNNKAPMVTISSIDDNLPSTSARSGQLSEARSALNTHRMRNVPNFNTLRQIGGVSSHQVALVDAQNVEHHTLYNAELNPAHEHNPEVIITGNERNFPEHYRILNSESNTDELEEEYGPYDSQEYQSMPTNVHAYETASQRSMSSTSFYVEEEQAPFVPDYLRSEYCEESEKYDDWEDADEMPKLNLEYIDEEKKEKLKRLQREYRLKEKQIIEGVTTPKQTKHQLSQSSSSSVPFQYFENQQYEFQEFEPQQYEQMQYKQKQNFRRKEQKKQRPEPYCLVSKKGHHFPEQQLKEQEYDQYQQHHQPQIQQGESWAKQSSSNLDDQYYDNNDQEQMVEPMQRMPVEFGQLWKKRSPSRFALEQMNATAKKRESTEKQENVYKKEIEFAPSSSQSKAKSLKSLPQITYNPNETYMTSISEESAENDNLFENKNERSCELFSPKTNRTIQDTSQDEHFEVHVANLKRKHIESERDDINQHMPLKPSIPPNIFCRLHCTIDGEAVLASSCTLCLTPIPEEPDREDDEDVSLDKVSIEKKHETPKVNKIKKNYFGKFPDNTSKFSNVSEEISVTCSTVKSNVSKQKNKLACALKVTVVKIENKSLDNSKSNSSKDNQQPDEDIDSGNGSTTGPSPQPRTNSADSLLSEVSSSTQPTTPPSGSPTQLGEINKQSHNVQFTTVINKNKIQEEEEEEDFSITGKRASTPPPMSCSKLERYFIMDLLESDVDDKDKKTAAKDNTSNIKEVTDKEIVIRKNPKKFISKIEIKKVSGQKNDAVSKPKNR